MRIVRHYSLYGMTGGLLLLGAAIQQQATLTGIVLLVQATFGHSLEKLLTLILVTHSSTAITATLLYNTRLLTPVGLNIYLITVNP
jgi:hypothetical protein